MQKKRQQNWFIVLGALVFTITLNGCGTTRWSDTARTATEQRLISNAIDDAVNAIDVSALSHQKIYFDVSNIDDSVQQKYLISTLRHHLLKNNCYLLEKKEEADYVVEARAGVVGTDRHDLLVGLPESSFGAGIPGMPAALPEIALYKKTNQLGVAKIGLFAYSRTEGNLVWSSDLKVSDKLAKSVWALGVGPIQRDGDGGPVRWAGEPTPSLPTIAMPSLPSLPQLANQPETEAPDHQPIPSSPPADEYQMPELKEQPANYEAGRINIKPANSATVDP